MTDKQRLALLNKAVRELKVTKEGYNKLGPHWKAAMTALDKLAADLRPDPAPKIPALGPIYAGGKSILLHDLTHATSGIPLYPAFDDAFFEGASIIAPEDIVVSRSSSSVPGLAFYCTGASTLKYWFGHLDRTHQSGERFKKGALIGKVCRNNVGGGPHCHCGINAEEILGRGKQFVHHTNYTHGAPTVGAQLKVALR